MVYESLPGKIRRVWLNWNPSMKTSKTPQASPCYFWTLAVKKHENTSTAVWTQREQTPPLCDEVSRGHAGWYPGHSGTTQVIVTETRCCELLWQFDFWQMKWKLHLLKWQGDTLTVFSSIVSDRNTVGHFGSSLKSLEAEAGTDGGVSITAADTK